MAERPRPGAEAWRRLKRGAHEANRPRRRGLKAHPLREPRRDRRGERAARTVTGRGVDAGIAEDRMFRLRHEIIRHLVAWEMTALHERRPRAEIEEDLTRAALIIRILNIYPRERRRLVGVGRDDIRL